MFYFCSNLQMLDLSAFNTSNVTTMEHMFSYCSNLTNLNINTFNTSNVTNMNDMFRQCVNLTTLNLSSFDTYNVTTMANMFRYSTNLKTIYVKRFDETTNKGWTTSSILNTESIFFGCFKLVGGNQTKYNENYVDITYACIDEEGKSGYFSEYK